MIKLSDISNNISLFFKEVSSQIEAEEQRALMGRTDNFFVELKDSENTPENRVLEVIRTGGSEHYNKLSLRSGVEEEYISEIVDKLIADKKIIKLSNDQNPIYRIKYDNFGLLKPLFGR